MTEQTSDKKCPRFPAYAVRELKQLRALVPPPTPASGETPRPSASLLLRLQDAIDGRCTLDRFQLATISTLIVQGYIIFFVFLIIILIMQFKILPMVSGIGEGAGAVGGLFGGGVAAGGSSLSPDELSSAFLYLLLVQGFFSGLTIGKLAEGSAKAGIKHSFALMLIAFLVSAGSNLLFGG